ncbi:type ISP restriction/modification enzyme [Sphingopyxis sp. BSNA05]|uniref:type ISP restriction/modification enzyme n=1 Tax=Sphingopyxis sp. BSNA05 TaxID=1236614 RepID=UPI001564612A|nr:type ISP restriction/modification enzyme [Sphingopyxis sp. BSNA05]
MVFNDPKMLNRRGPETQAVWGDENIGFYAMPSGTRAGPALWCHGLLPDYHAFRGSYGGYAFPLYDRRPEENDINLSPHLLEGLHAAYGGDMPAEDIFDAILALLSANSYTMRFAEDLEDVFPHVPFPADREVFNQAVAIGASIRAVETFARAPDRNYVATRLETPPTGVLGDTVLRDGEIILCADGSGRLTGVTEAVWSFAVSGYRILPRWLDAREGQPVDLELVEQIRDIAARIAELIDLFDQADNVLESTLVDCLTREALGFGEEEADDDGQD